MKENTVAQRVVETYADPENKKGRLVITAKLYSLGEQAPYFSVTTTSGANHEAILKARPDLKFITDLHLAREDGVPMHAVSNAAYYFREGKYEQMAEIMRMDEPQKKQLIGDLTLRAAEVREDAEQEYAKAYKDCINSLDRFANWRNNQKGRNLQVVLKEMLEPFVDDLIHTIRVMQNINEVVKFTDKVLPLIKEADTILSVAKSQIRSPRSEPKDWKKTMEKVRDFHTEVGRVVRDQMTVIRTSYANSRRDKYISSYFDSYVDRYLKDKWEREAEQALIWLKESDYDSDFDEEGHDPQTESLVKLNGNIVPVVDVHNYGYLPQIDLGGEEYILAADDKQAADATEEYWQDMADRDPEELTCIVGKETLVKWALGQPAGPGTQACRSLSEWINLNGEYPQETWASYDGEQREIMISMGLCEDLGFSYDVSRVEWDNELEDDDDESPPDWIPVIAFRSN